MKIALNCLVLWLLGLAAAGRAQEPLAPLTLEQLEQMALSRNPTLVQATAAVDAARGRARSMGFGAEVRGPDERQTGELLTEVEPDDLLKFGLIPEFVGRLPVLATLEELDEGALIQILTEPKNALIKQYQRLFHMEGVELEVRVSALGAVAKRALARKTGARGLRSILEQILLDTMYELPTLENVSKVVVDESMVSADGKPLLIYSEQHKVASGSG